MALPKWLFFQPLLSASFKLGEKNKNNLFLFRLTATAHKSLRVGNDQLRVFSTTEKSPSGFLHDNHFPLLESSLVALTTWKVL